ncbi:MAG: hypothetical protein NT154_02265, partial [Verrucomicrobia bacterium]|nr:hypothetical protein [Verrucomicrobiota bacterium]
GALAGTDGVVITGSAGDTTVGGVALETSCVRFGMGAASGFGFSTFSGGEVTTVGAGFGALLVAGLMEL